jgi:hypothetical protein
MMDLRGRFCGVVDWGNPLAGDERFEGLHHVRQAAFLHDEIDARRRRQSRATKRVSVGREEDDLRLGQDALQNGRYLDTVQSRHLQIKQDEVGPEFLCLLDSFKTAASFAANLEIDISLQKGPDDTADLRAVVDDEYSVRHHT